ncbi:MAG: biotin/lipoate--protein ligase family protein [Pseudomonadota bacterium]
MKKAPTLPPLLKGHRVEAGKSPVARARGMVAKGNLAAGDILWSEDRNALRFALVLEPEVERNRCSEMLYLLMVAFGDAAGAISAPEIAITYRWPSQVLINDAVVGDVDLILPDETPDGVPAWMIAGMNIAIKPDRVEHDPGIHADQTTMWDEGCGDISRTELLESVARHIVNWIHTWSEDGFKPVHEQWNGRLNEKQQLVSGVVDGDFVGLDETGNVLIKTGGEITSVSTLDTLITVQNNAARNS